MKQPPSHGLLVVDKPGGITARAAVDRARRWFARRTRVGHTGTLDPLATGVLVLTVGSATRLADYVQQMPKTYRTTIRLGAKSDSDDADGRIVPIEAAPRPDRQQLEQVIADFVGVIKQVPPAYSAAKIAGRRAYALARRGQDVALQPRHVHVHGIELWRYDFPQLELCVRCGKGTYIRALARDIGARLQTGGYVETLRRIQVGPFRVEEALSLDADAATATARLLPLRAAVSALSSLRLPADLLGRLCHGQPVPWKASLVVEKEPRPGDQVAVVDDSNNLIALGMIDGELLRPLKVFVG